MRTETIDGVVYYVWKAGDELPDYQPIDYQWLDDDGVWKEGDANTEYWSNCYDRRWPKLVNDRARHQRMIDEAFEKVDTNNLISSAVYATSYMRRIDVNNLGNQTLKDIAYMCAYLKRMMEQVQAEIYKESEVKE